MSMQSGVPLIDPKANKKKILVATPKLSDVQADINLSMERVNQSAQYKMAEFDKWVDFRNVFHLEV